MACDMALNDELDLTPASHLSGVHQVFAWTAGDPAKLPKGIDRCLAGLRAAIRWEPVSLPASAILEEFIG